MSLLLLFASESLACGGLITADMDTKIAASDAQQAYFEIGEASVKVSYRVRYHGDADDFAWIIPVPGTVLSVEEGEEAVFDRLASITAPRVEWDSPESDSVPACGCAGQSDSAYSLKGGENRDIGSDTGGVEVLGAGFAGGFAYQVLSASGPGAMSGWLAENGYDGSVSADQIAAYESDPLGFVWIAAKLRPEVPTTDEAGVVIHPLVIEYSAAADGTLHALFPSRMGQSIQLSEVRNEIFVRAPERVEAAGGWSTAELTTDEYDIEGQEGDDPDTLYDALLASQGAQKAVWTVFSDTVTDDNGESYFLTRLDTLVAPATNTSDLELVSAGDSQQSRTVIYMPQAYDTAYGLIFAPLAGLVGWRLRRRYPSS
mgnify:CR=1 FL=1